MTIRKLPAPPKVRRCPEGHTLETPDLHVPTTVDGRLRTLAIPYCETCFREHVNLSVFIEPGT